MPSKAHYKTSVAQWMWLMNMHITGCDNFGVQSTNESLTTHAYSTAVPPHFRAFASI